MATYLDKERREALRRDAVLNSAGYDDFGLHLPTAEKFLDGLGWLYRHYFRVKTHHIDRVPQGRVLLIANHGGQIPFDGFFVAMAMALDAQPPRLVRAMVERWFPSLPFVSTVFYRCGQVVGDPRNCLRLLQQDACLLVFPEGVRGAGKPYGQRYQLQRFGTGFLRLALEAKAPIVPVGVVGSEETYPALFHVKALSRAMGIPYLPVTPTFPALGPMGMIPLPVGIDLHFGEPLRFDLDPDASDNEVEEKVGVVQQAIQDILDEQVALRPDLKAMGQIFSHLPFAGRPKKAAPK